MALPSEQETDGFYDDMTIKSKIDSFRLRRKLKRDKPHIWRVPSVNAVYIQNYKVGTRSLRLAISKFLYEQETKNTVEDLGAEVVEALDKKYSHFMHLENMRSKWPEAFVFAFVRNPLSRLYSCYTNKITDAKRQGIKNQFQSFGIDFDISFDDFVRFVADVPDALSDRHFRSQSWFVSVQGDIITDYLGKLENFEHDWGELRDRFGFPALAHKNSSSRRTEDFRKHYNPETYQLALERYRVDIEMLGYEDAV